MSVLCRGECCGVALAVDDRHNFLRILLLEKSRIQQYMIAGVNYHNLVLVVFLGIHYPRHQYRGLGDQKSSALNHQGKYPMRFCQLVELAYMVFSHLGRGWHRVVVEYWRSPSNVKGVDMERRMLFLHLCHKCIHLVQRMCVA